VFWIVGNRGQSYAGRLPKLSVVQDYLMAVQDPTPIAAKAAHPFVVPGELQAERRRRVARVKRAIRRQTSGGVQHLNVELNGETLVLRGRCTSFYCKQKAQHAAMDHLAGETLDNQIQVDVLPR
jgi:hypothetical protein